MVLFIFYQCELYTCYLAIHNLIRLAAKLAEEYGFSSDLHFS